MFSWQQSLSRAAKMTVASCLVEKRFKESCLSLSLNCFGFKSKNYLLTFSVLQLFIRALLAPPGALGGVTVWDTSSPVQQLALSVLICSM